MGAYGKAGGILPEPPAGSGLQPSGSGPGVQSPEAGAQAPNILGLITAIGAGQVKALLVIDGNPLFTLPEQEKLRSALASVPFIASFSSFLDETAAMSDLILPHHVPLERWIDDVPEPGVGFPVRTLAGPAVQPRWETRDTGDVLLKWQALGGKAAEALPFENMAAAIKESFRSVHSLKAGNITDDDFNAFYRKVTAAGGWWNQEGLKAQGAGPRAKVQFVMPSAPIAAAAYTGDPSQFPFMLHVSIAGVCRRVPPIYRGCRKCRIR